MLNANGEVEEERAGQGRRLRPKSKKEPGMAKQRIGIPVPGLEKLAGVLLIL